tara:strand:- start:2087 stop:2662 length:576 start_codon:yes stop_codon:yes gene_type:complete
MAKLQYNEVTPKKTIILDGDPYSVLSSAISKKDRQKASNNVKLKNLRTGATLDRTFHQADVLEEAEMEKREVKYLYHNRGEYWFCSPDNPGERFKLEEEIVGKLADFVTENSLVEALMFNDEIIGINTPIKVHLKVAEASDAVKGNTSSGATKEVKLETGLTIQVPQFINQGDVVAVNTDTVSYTERIDKA